jgi:FKBP-type peptidyl-prolyl cis-trans isomerase
MTEFDKKNPPEAAGELLNSKASKDTKKLQDSVVPAPPTAKGETKTTPGGVKYETLRQGTGPEVKVGDRVMLHYTGTLDDGTVFDTSHKDRDDPYEYLVATSNKLIRGWHEGITGMRVGELRRLTIPPKLAYGAKGQHTIPPDATLHFDIELLSVAPTPGLPEPTKAK